MKNKTVIAYILICCVFASFLSACSTKSSDKVSQEDPFSLVEPIENFVEQNTYSRIGETVASASYADVTFEDVFRWHDWGVFTAIVQITEYLDEYMPYQDMDSDNGMTYFRAKIITVYAGENQVGEEIILAQLGTSKSSYDEYPLFQLGSLFLLNLYEIEIEVFAKPYDDIVYSFGAGIATLEIVDIDGAYYVLNRGIPAFIPESIPEISEELREKIVPQINKRDILSDNQLLFGIYHLADFEEYIKTLVS